MGFNGYITNNTGGRDQQRLRSKSLLVDVGFFFGGVALAPTLDINWGLS